MTRLTQGLQGVAIEVVGTTFDGYPKVFTEIEVRYTFSGHRLKTELIEKAIPLMEEKYCPISAMLGKASTIRHVWRIAEPQASPT